MSALPSKKNQTSLLFTNLDKGCEALSLDLSTIQKQQLIEYLLELEKWNKTYNLTAIRAIEDMLVQHIFDCLSVIPAIKAFEFKQGRSLKNVVDVGSGAGLPAVVIAIARPDLDVICIDAVEKKHVFVSHIVNKLGLVNLKSMHARVESIHGLRVDLVMSRAFSGLSTFIELAAGLVADTGSIAAMKSKRLECEVEDLNHKQLPWEIDNIVQLQVPQLDAERFLVWVRRKSHE